MWVCMHGIDKGVRDAAKTEAAGEEGTVGLHVFERRGRGEVYLVDLIATGCRREGTSAKEDDLGVRGIVSSWVAGIIEGFCRTLLERADARG